MNTIQTKMQCLIWGAHLVVALTSGSINGNSLKALQTLFIDISAAGRCFVKDKQISHHSGTHFSDKSLDSVPTAVEINSLNPLALFPGSHGGVQILSDAVFLW